MPRSIKAVFVPGDRHCPAYIYCCYRKHNGSVRIFDAVGLFDYDRDASAKMTEAMMRMGEWIEVGSANGCTVQPIPNLKGVPK